MWEERDMTVQGDLKPRALRPLEAPAILPEGWLLDQLRTQATGLSGYLDEFWPDVAESGWIGGKAEGWERGPYWLDGLVPLAMTLWDGQLMAKVEHWIDYIIDHQAEDGWLGPEQDTATGRYEARDPWPVFVALKALTQFYEWWPEERIILCIQRFMRCLDRQLDERPLFSWGWVRWADLVLSIHWLYDHTSEDWLLTLAAKVKAQGFDWRQHFDAFPYTDKTEPENQNLISHVVNNAMAVKAPAVWWRQSGDEVDRTGTQRIIAELDRYHGQVTGVFSGDEHLAGKSPSQGTELCAVVEYMFSLETAISILGDPALADRLERIAYNALPATFTPDMWAHQYDQQANQILCAVVEDRVYASNGPDANIFGLAPNYGCCTANMHQGWPKFVNSLWMGTPDGGLAAISYAPCRVLVSPNDDSVVTLYVEGNYPFGETVTLTVEADAPTDLTLYLRIPGWCHGATIEGDGWTRKNLTPGRFVPIRRTWEGETTIELYLPMPVRAEPRCNNSIALLRGPLVLSMPIREDWRQIAGEAPRGDWEVHPLTPWNVALDIDREAVDSAVEVFELTPSWRAFARHLPPLVVRARGKLAPTWKVEHNAAAPPPKSPVRGAGKLFDVELLPYGCCRLRITEFPVLAPSAKRRR
jgi:hypothetical protein